MTSTNIQDVTEIVLNRPKVYKLDKENALLPTKAHKGDAAFDVYASEPVLLDAGKVTPVPTGLILVPPQGYFIRLASRSGLALKGITVEAGIIDPGYRGEVKVLLYNTTNTPYHVVNGDRVAQILIERVYPFHTFDEVSEIPPNLIDSRNGGFGSTGR